MRDRNEGRAGRGYRINLSILERQNAFLNELVDILARYASAFSKVVLRQQPGGTVFDIGHVLLEIFGGVAGREV